MDRFEKNMAQAQDLCLGLGTMAEKRNASPQAMTMAATNSLASCLATSAMLHILMKGMTRSEAIAEMKETGIGLLAHVMQQALFKITTTDLPSLVKGYNAANPDHAVNDLKPGWDD